MAQVQQELPIGPTEYHVHLGTLILRLDPLKADSSSSSTWAPFGSQHLLLGIWLDSESNHHAINVLSRIFKDPGLSFKAEYIVYGDIVTVRAYLLPLDAPGSQWKRTRVTDRRTWLCKLFDLLYNGWEAVTLESGSNGEPLFARTREDAERMADLYASVPSPSTPNLADAVSWSDQDLEWRLENEVDIDGMKSPLYKYQFRSVGKMLQMETEPGKMVDPKFTEMREANRESSYFINLCDGTWDIQRHPGWYELPKGGILCEQMGVGKTVMCLALILGTLHQPVRPPPHEIDLSPVVTDYATNHYAFESYRDLRVEIGRPEPKEYVRPSLQEICADILTKHSPKDLSGPLISPAMSILTPQFLDRKPLYWKYPPDDSCVRAAKKKFLVKQSTRMYLANTTLVVVPALLVPQWKSEIEKHLQPGALKLLVIEKRGQSELSDDIRELVEYDVILMDIDFFSHQSPMSLMRQGRASQGSVLEKARWKRIILDEGHVAAAKSSNAVLLARSLSIERRWIVSGSKCNDSPTKHLQQGGEMQIESISDESIPAPVVIRKWPTRDLDDAAKIGVMIGSFLAAEPFMSEGHFQSEVVAHLRPAKGPRYGAVRRLKALMGAFMVKHARGQIDEERGLPPVAITTVKLRFHPMQLISYNVLAAFAASNVYSTSRNDPGHFLNPKNQKHLNDLVANMRLALFWYSARGLDIAASLSRTRDIYNDESLNHDDTARGALLASIKAFETALNTPGWEEWMEYGICAPFEMDPTVFPSKVRMAWSDSMDTCPDAIDTAKLARLRENNTRGATEQELHIAGWDCRVENVAEFFQEMEKVADRANRFGEKEKKTLAQRKKERDEAKREAKNAMVHSPTKIKKKRSNVQKSKQKSEKKGKDGDSTEIETPTSDEETVIDLTEIPEDSCPRPLPTSIRTTSRSSKLNFVIKTIIESDPLDKFIIWADAYELGHLKEALELFRYKFCVVGSYVSAEERKVSIQQFQQPDVRVCISDLKHAARGLNLVVANRMIFLTPVWNPDVQAQAIKRIHRIGQIRPTLVQILVTEGTFEEDIVSRGKNTRSDKEEQVYARQMIENPRFLEESEPPIQPMFDLPFLPNEEDAMKKSLDDVQSEVNNLPGESMDIDSILSESPGSTPPESILITPASNDNGQWSTSIPMTPLPTKRLLDSNDEPPVKRVRFTSETIP